MPRDNEKQYNCVVPVFLFGKIADAGADEVQMAIDTALSAQPSWQALPQERLSPIHTKLLQHTTTLLRRWLVCIKHSFLIFF